MADNWAIVSSVGLIVIALGIIVFYLIPLQARLLAGKKDWLTGLRWRLLLVSIFIATASSPIIVNRLLRTYFGVQSVFLSNISALATGVAFLAFSIAFVSVYNYKKKE